MVAAPQPLPAVTMLPTAAMVASMIATNKVQVSHILDQGDSSEVAVPSNAQIRIWDDNYYRLKEGDPQSTASARQNNVQQWKSG